MTGLPNGALALIPARAGSKGLIDKNLARVGSLSLLGRAVLVARKAPGVERVVVSTDGQRIAEEAERFGAEIHHRPERLATDQSPVAETIRDVLGQLRAEQCCPPYGLLLEPTSPFRSVEDVTRCLHAVHAGADSAATFTEACLHPNRAFTIDGDRVAPFIAGAVPWQPRQSLQPPAYQLTGSCYAFKCQGFPSEGLSVLFGRIAPVLVPRERAVDIDDEFDLGVANALCSD